MRPVIDLFDAGSYASDSRLMGNTGWSAIGDPIASVSGAAELAFFFACATDKSESR
jgi:hypothetical protein